MDIARAQVTKLKPSVPMLTLVLPEQAPSDTFVTRNGVVLKSAALGLPLPVDPGEYVIVTHVPGAPERELRVSLALGETKTLTLALPESTSQPSGARANTSEESKRPRSVPSEQPAAAAPPAGRSAAYIAGGVGAAGIVLGSITGVLVLSKKSTVRDNCRNHDCNETGLSAANSAQKLALISDVGFGVGIAGAALAAVLFFTEKGESAPAKGSVWQPLIAAGPRGLAAGFARHF
jgi:hypothetical protein